MEPCSCHSYQSFYSISIKSLCHQSSIRGMLQIRNDWDQPAGCRNLTGQRCWRTDNRLDYKLPRWAKNEQSVLARGKLCPLQTWDPVTLHGSKWLSIRVFTSMIPVLYWTDSLGIKDNAIQLHSLCLAFYTAFLKPFRHFYLKTISTISKAPILHE